MSRHIFLVVATEYEGSMVCAAFEAKRDAEALKAACDAFDEARPVLDADLNNGAFDKRGNGESRDTARADSASTAATGA